MSNEKIKLILSYNPDRDDFFPIEGEELDAKNNTYLIIDETEEQSTLSFPESSSLIQKRTIERRVSSYLKVGYPIGNKGLRIGANFPLEKIGVGEKLPDILMTHGHSFGKSRLQRDEIPDYVEKGDTYDVVPGSAAVKALESSPTHTQEKEVHLKPIPGKKAKVKAPEPVVEPESPKLQPTSTETKGEDNEIFALGQFVDQFVRDGKIVMVHMEEGKYKLQTLKNIANRLSYDLDTKFEIEGSDLFQA
jgi:hypothetical protein